MTCLILEDARKVPALFIWNGPVERRDIDEWSARHGWVIPEDLLQFWTSTGGGEVLESETFLRPLVSAGGHEEVAEVTRWCRNRGLPDGVVVFHEGLGFTGVRCRDGVYLSFDSGLRAAGQYSSLDHWYTQFLRAEYGPRYGFPP
jgi:hypothetical protein